MKMLILAGFLACSTIAFAQTRIDKTIAVPSGNTVSINLEFPELIKIHTWTKKEVVIRGVVQINNGENDGAFEITSASENGTTSITGNIKDRNKIPKRITIRQAEKDVYFQTDDMNHPDVLKFIADHGGKYQYLSHGVDINIELEIFVPEGMRTILKSKFGMVEITEFNAPLTVNAAHGGVDASINVASTGAFSAKTLHGEIFTNLDTKFSVANPKRDYDFGLQVSSTFNGKYPMELEASHGHIYLRKVR